MRAIAAFATSEAGKAFARIEQSWGRDPAAALEPVDDVLAHNLRAALLITMAKDEAPADDGVERARAAGQKIREQLNG